ncbi:MAG: glutamate--cysteine ligase [Bdellovibrionaceae bacterium]|nr:glutamate--cysteine ligase [Pseudobdellovibrionaceae bacterium]
MAYTRTELHQQILSKKNSVCDWFQSKTKNAFIPIYSSYDVRDAGYKVANVDANIYPAGFNNICPTDKETSIDLMVKYLDEKYSKDLQRILLVTEEHTQNPYYWDNVVTIKDLMESAGKQVRVGFGTKLENPLTVKSANGHEVLVESAWGDSKIFSEFKPQLIVSNNDFSEAHEEWSKTVTVPINPPRELGWYQRKKSDYFKFYNELVSEFADVAGVDPFVFQVKTEYFPHFDINSESSRADLAKDVDDVLKSLDVEYKKRGIDQKPFVFVKNNSGTYGLAVIRVQSASEILEWTYKSRKKMKAAKGGRDVEEVIIQEGIPSIVEKDGVVAEPVIYMIGGDLAGGFLRTHSEKDSTESLNSPGAIYKRLCVSDLEIRPEGCPMENVYGWTSKIGSLAISMEAAKLKT